MIAAKPKKTMVKPRAILPMLFSRRAVMAMLKVPPIFRNMALTPLMLATWFGISSIQALLEAGKPTPIPIPTREILINHFGGLTNMIGEYNEAPQGKKYMILTLEIENRGYNTFSTNPLYWKVEVDNIQYSISIATYSLIDKLDTVEIKDGGKIKGTLAFEVPEGAKEYKVKYDAFQEYNIIWDRIPG